MSIFSVIKSIVKETGEVASDIYSDVLSTFSTNTSYNADTKKTSYSGFNTGNALKTTGMSLAAAPAAADLSAQGSGNILKSAGNLVSKAFTSLKPTTQLALAAGGTTLGIAASKSPKLQKQLINAPASAVNFAGNLGTLYENPSMANAKTLAKENPIIAGGIALGTVGLVGLGTSSLVSNYLNTKAVKENTSVSSQWTETLNNAISGGTISNLSTDNIPTQATNKYDVKQAKTESESAYDIAKLQSETQIELAKIAATAQVAPVATPLATPVNTVTKKKTTKKKTAKKKTTKKKKVTKKKAKTIKRKTSKKKKKVKK
jgi:hypothetical protein